MNNQALVRLYCCGGAGANIGQVMIKEGYTKSEKGFADIETAFIDTSSSNLSDAVKEDMIYLVEGLDGSGQKRSLNHKDIIPRVKDIIQNFPPASLNIVLHSLSGGS